MTRFFMNPNSRFAAAPVPPSGVSTDAMLQENYRRLQQLESQLSPEELREVKLQAMRPYRTRNIALSLGLFGSMLAIYGYTMYKMRPDNFNELEGLEQYVAKTPAAPAAPKQ
ncbi:hypothetical protein BC831DRAFT_489968 [Entophlyctis helioformis]|nr:hypothetical protein BC831DRAFT_489968 [Entophlyctis helioformis]